MAKPLERVEITMVADAKAAPGVLRGFYQWCEESADNISMFEEVWRRNRVMIARTTLAPLVLM